MPDTHQVSRTSLGRTHSCAPPGAQLLRPPPRPGRRRSSAMAPAQGGEDWTEAPGALGEASSSLTADSSSASRTGSSRRKSAALSCIVAHPVCCPPAFAPSPQNSDIEHVAQTFCSASSAPVFGTTVCAQASERERRAVGENRECTRLRERAHAHARTRD